MNTISREKFLTQYKDFLEIGKVDTGILKVYLTLTKRSDEDIHKLNTILPLIISSIDWEGIYEYIGKSFNVHILKYNNKIKLW